jgi:hypothetical protein
MHAFNHSSIFRAIYIHGADYEPDFLSHLVVFALRLRNAGISDRGLLFLNETGILVLIQMFVFYID